MTSETVRTAWASVLAAALSVAPSLALAQHPFPTSAGEEQKAAEIAEAVAEADEDAVKALTALLDEPNPRVQAAALVALLQLSHKELDLKAPLAKVKAWAGPRPPYSRAALKVAGVALEHRLPRQKRVAWLVAMTGVEGDFERRMAVEALRGHDDDAVLEALEALANDPFEDMRGDFDMRAIARIAFEAWWAMRSKGVDLDERPPILVKTLALGEPYRSRWCDAACEMLEREGHAIVPTLVPMLKGKDRRAKLWAMRTLRYIGGSKAIAALQDTWVADFESRDRLARDAALRGLLEHPDRRVLPQLVARFVKDDELLVAWRGVYGLDKLDDDEAVAKLEAAAEDQRELVRMQAAAQLAHRGNAGGQLSILTGIASQTEVIRLIARWALLQLPDHGKVCERLIELLKVNDEAERKLPEKRRDTLLEIRVELLRQIAAWDPERQDHRPLSYAIRDLLADRHLAGRAAATLRKMGFVVERRAGKLKVTGSTR